MNEKNQPAEDINLLDLIPQQNISWERSKEGRLILLNPKFKQPLLQKYLLPRLKYPYFKINLDEVGSFIMEHCNGKLTVREIGEALHKEFGDKVSPLYDRLAQFLKHLERNQFIKYKNISPTPDRD